MKLKDLKEKLKNKVQASKTKQFVEEHKSDITKYVIIFGGSALSYVICRKAFYSGYQQGFKDGALLSALSFDTAMTANNVEPETVQKLAKSSAETFKQITGHVPTK